MKKSQVHGQIFVYILTVVLVSFILVYGYNAIKNLKNRAEQISCLKLKNDLQISVESILSEFGSIKIKEIDICGGYKKICFVETFETPFLTSNVDPLIRDSVSSNAGKNVFLVDKIAKESFYIGRISVDPDVLCISEASNKVRLKLEGRGNHAILSKAS